LDGSRKCELAGRGFDWRRYAVAPAAVSVLVKDALQPVGPTRRAGLQLGPPLWAIVIQRVARGDQVLANLFARRLGHPVENELLQQLREAR
jgi:hypothetical protein